jgi:hypothetical protein
LGLIALCSSYKPYAKMLTAHNGKIGFDESAQSGLYLKGRDRSKSTLLKVEARKKRAAEDIEEEPLDLTPRKKVSYPFWPTLAQTDWPLR